MTAFTGYTSMSTGQWELRPVVIEIDVIPTRGIMTGGAIPAELTVMSILLLMTGKAVRGCACKYMVAMARLT